LTLDCTEYTWFLEFSVLICRTMYCMNIAPTVQCLQVIIKVICSSYHDVNDLIAMLVTWVICTNHDVQLFFQWKWFLHMEKISVTIPQLPILIFPTPLTLVKNWKLYFKWIKHWENSVVFFILPPNMLLWVHITWEEFP
jgi:hypothetical protein